MKLIYYIPALLVRFLPLSSHFVSSWERNRESRHRPPLGECCGAAPSSSQISSLSRAHLHWTRPYHNETQWLAWRTWDLGPTPQTNMVMTHYIETSATMRGFNKSYSSPSIPNLKWRLLGNSKMYRDFILLMDILQLISILNTWNIQYNFF